MKKGMRPSGDKNFAEMMRRAIALQRAQRFHDAIAVYRQIFLMYPGKVEALTYCGVALLETGQAAGAVDMLRAAVDASAQSVDARSYLGNALLLTEDWDAAEAAYRGALDIAPGDARTQNNLGVLLRKRDRSNEAAECFRRALAVDPNYVQAQNNICQAYTKLGKTDKAIAAGKRAVEINPRYPDGYNSLGVALMEADRINEAITAFRGALAIRPKYLEALTNIAIALVNGGKSQDAVDVTDTCLEVDPGNVEALATRSVALNEAGDFKSLSTLVDFDLLLHEIQIDPGPEFDSLAGFNDALAQHIRGHPSLEFAPPNQATRGGMHSGDLLADPKGPMVRFERIIGEAFDRYVAALPAELEHPFLARKPTRWTLNVWALVLQAQGYQVPHIHHSGWISGCYYVQVSEAVSEPEDGHQGWIELGRPQSIYRTTGTPDIRLVRPKEGLMVLFPSFFFHRTIPFEAVAERICIAFDVQPADGHHPPPL